MIPHLKNLGWLVLFLAALAFLFGMIYIRYSMYLEWLGRHG